MKCFARPGLACVLCLIVVRAAAGDTPPATEPQDPELQRELLEREQADQEARLKMVEWCKQHKAFEPEDIARLTPEEKTECDVLGAMGNQVDTDNTRWLQGIVEAQGWPTRARVGKNGAQAAWLLVQHADAEPKFQRYCLDLMTKLPKEAVLPDRVAYLTDRVLLAEDKKQIYGTQLRFAKGKLESRQVEDAVNVDQRRAEVGLEPLAEYIKSAEAIYLGEPK